MKVTRRMSWAHRAHLRWNPWARRLAPRDARTKRPLRRRGVLFGFMWAVNDRLAAEWVPAYVHHAVYGLDGLYEHIVAGPPPRGTGVMTQRGPIRLLESPLDVFKRALEVQREIEAEQERRAREAPWGGQAAPVARVRRVSR